MMRQQYHLHRLLLDTDATLPPINRSKLSSSYTGSDTNFDSNMVIILAALLCALICALGLNSIVRCALRCSQRLAFENPDRTAARLATTGMKRDALSQIPVVVYKSGLDTPTTDCPICLGEFVEGEKVRSITAIEHHHCTTVDPLFEHYHRDLQKATCNFTILIGQGAFGSVYKAQMLTGETVAVKVLAIDSNQGAKEFQTEMVFDVKLWIRLFLDKYGRHCVDTTYRTNYFFGLVHIYKLV